MTNEASKLKQKQALKKYLVFTLMFAVFAGSMYLIFAPSEKDRKEKEQLAGFNTELPDPRNAGIIGDKKTAYEQEMMRLKQKEKMRTLEELSFGPETEKADSAFQNGMLSLETDGKETQPSPYGGTTYRGSSFNSSNSAYKDINRTLGSFYESHVKILKKRRCGKKSKRSARRFPGSRMCNRPLMTSNWHYWKSPTNLQPSTCRQVKTPPENRTATGKEP